MPDDTPEAFPNVRITEDDQFSEAEEASEGEIIAEERRGKRIAASEDEEGEDLFDDDMQRDYEQDPELDQYDPTMIDDTTEHKELTAQERRDAERDIKKREKQKKTLAAEVSGSGGRSGLTGIAEMFASLGIEDDDSDDEDEDGENRADMLRRRRPARGFGHKPDDELIEQAKSALPDINRVDVSSEKSLPMIIRGLWDDRVCEVISIIFEGLIWSVPSESTEKGKPTPLYLEKLQAMAREERHSIQIEWRHLNEYAPRLCDWVIHLPGHVIGTFDTVLTRITLAMYPKLYLQKIVCARITSFPVVESIRQLSVKHLNRLVVTEGVCIRRSDVYSRLRTVYYECIKCAYDGNGPYDQLQLTEEQKRKIICVNCQSTGPFNVTREKTVFDKYQKIFIQECTDSVPAGHVPRQKTAILLGDLVDTVRPGDEIILAGILEARQDTLTNAKMGFPVFATWFITNNVQKRREKMLKEQTERDVAIIKALAKNPAIREKIISSIAPSIWGHRHVKTAIATTLFGGVRREIVGKHTIRGDINILIIGDPGMGKSQFLRFVQHIFPRTVLTTGKGASAVGLTAAVKRDPQTGEWTLQGGAFVLADGGICLIDEFDKMSDQDRVSIHEAMEQQSISISKAGIVASLRARCAVIAAANPIGGRYNASLSLAENVDLSDPILSRFDVVCVVRDQCFPLHDEHLASYVLDSHIDAHPEAGLITDQTAAVEDDIDTRLDQDGMPMWVRGPGRIPDAMLRQYILYARSWSKPEVKLLDQSRLTEFYVALRKATINAGGMPLTVRHFESIIRMAVANAKMRLAKIVERQDMDFAISTLLESVIQTQRQASSSRLSGLFARYRALASSPDEIIEQVLLQIFTRQMSQSFQAPSSDILSQTQAYRKSHNVSLSLKQVKILVKSVHGLPEISVNHFIATERFKEKYQIIIQDTEHMIAPKPVAS